MNQYGLTPMLRGREWRFRRHFCGQQKLATLVQPCIAGERSVSQSRSTSDALFVLDKNIGRVSECSLYLYFSIAPSSKESVADWVLLNIDLCAIMCIDSLNCSLWITVIGNSVIKFLDCQECGIYGFIWLIDTQYIDRRWCRMKNRSQFGHLKTFTELVVEYQVFDTVEAAEEMQQFPHSNLFFDKNYFKAKTDVWIVCFQ